MRLRLLTYNIHKGVGTDGERSLDRIADVVRHYDPDIVALQEVLWYEPRLDMRPQPEELAALLGLEHGVVALNVPRRTGIYGNVTLARLPVREHANVDLTIPLKKARSALYTCFDAGGAPLHVYNVHLGLARFERKIQMQTLVDDADAVAPDGAPALIVGDTNDWRDRLHGEVLGRAGFDPPPGRKGAARGTFPSWYPVGQLDRVFARGAVQLRRVYASRLALARVASDHLPVVADVEIATR